MSAQGKKILRINGRVVDRKTSVGVAGLKVEAWDKDLIIKNPVGSAVTDAQGSFLIEIPKPLFKDLFADRAGILFFKVFSADNLIASTESSVLWSRDAADNEIIIQVDIAPSEKEQIEPFIISGVVRRSDSTPFEGAFVRIFKTSFPETSVGEARTDAIGRYQITYEGIQPGEAVVLIEHIVRAFDSKEKLIAASSKFFPQPTLSFDLTATTNEPSPFMVRGQVRTSTGTPISEATVKIFGILANQEELLEPQAVTDLGGLYEIFYFPGKYHVSINPDARLIIRVFDNSGKLLKESPRFQASPEEHWDAIVDSVRPPRFIVNGHVKRSDGSAIKNGVVAIFGNDGAVEVELNRDVTDDTGFYEIHYSIGQISPTVNIGEIVVVRLLGEAGNVLHSSDPFTAIELKTVNLIVPVVQPPDTQTFEVNGKITQLNGDPVRTIVVRVYETGLFGERLVGETETNNEGRYKITFPVSQPNNNTQVVKHLIVRVIEGSDPPPSVTRRNALSPAVIDVQLTGPGFRGLSEYEVILERVTRNLDGLSLAGLTVDQVKFLSSVTGFSALNIAFVVVAARLAGQTLLPAAPFYGFFRKGLPTTLPALLTVSESEQRRAFEAALSNNTIPFQFNTQVNSFLSRLRQLLTDQAFQPREGGRPSLGAILNTVLHSRSKEEMFLSLYFDRQGSIQDFWSDLRGRADFDDTVDDLQFALQAAALTANHLPMVERLQQIRRTENVGIRDLAKFSETRWEEIIRQAAGAGPLSFPPDIVGNNDTEKMSNYVRGITGIVEDAFPTDFIAGRIAMEDLSMVPGKADLLTFFGNNSPFEIDKANIRNYIAVDPATTLNGVVDEAGLIRELESYQRVRNVAPRYNQMRALLDSGINSATSISRLSRESFLAQHGDKLGGEAEALMIYDTSQQVSAAALNVLSDLQGLAGGGDLEVLPRITIGDGTQIEREEDSRLSWKTLFGSTSFCECAHCRSVLSPAAYLVDILHFLQDRKVGTEIGSGGEITHLSALDVLSRRRPDLVFISLSCENTNTPVPYIDLLNELLEEAISNLIFHIEGDFAADLNNGVISVQLRNSLKSNGYELTAEAAVVKQESGFWWQIIDKSWVLRIQQSQPPDYRVDPYPQTGGTAEELIANPEHVNDRAYTTLAQAVYPWQLPFNLPVEQVRAYLDHLGVPRHEVMRAFQNQSPTSSSSNLKDRDVDGEYLGLTVRDRQIIAKEKQHPTDPDEPLHEFWGYTTLPTPSLVDKLKKVNEFLDRSGLTHEELVSLLDLRFVNPTPQNKSVDIEPKTTCDIDQMTLTGLNDALLSKIHRLVRLRRKLGWTMRELDMAITALGVSDIDGILLSKLAAVKRLRAELRLPLDQLLSLWADINRDGEDSLYNRLFLNKAVTNPVDEDFKLETSSKIRENIPIILAALGITREELAEIMTDASVTDQSGLNLSNLSKLYRYKVLARALKLSIHDLIILKDLFRQRAGMDPFRSQDPSSTVEFLMGFNRIRASSFSVAELDYLLQRILTEPSDLAPDEKEVSDLLGAIRAELQKIASENMYAPENVDASGELVREKLLLLGFDSQTIQQLIEIIQGKFVPQTPAADFIFERVLLNALAFTVPLQDRIGQSLTFPREMRDKIFYDSSSRELCFIGVMTSEERSKLEDLSADTEYRNALNTLFGAPANRLPVGKLTVSGSDAAHLAAPPRADATEAEKQNLVEEKFNILMSKLLPTLRDRLGRMAVKQKIAEALRLDPNTTELLLTVHVMSPDHRDAVAMIEFLSPRFAASDPEVIPSKDSFPSQFGTFMLLHKINLIISKFKIAKDPSKHDDIKEQVIWLFQHHPDARRLDLNSLPIFNRSTITDSFERWSNLADLFRLRDRLPKGVEALSEIFSIGSAAPVDANNLSLAVSNRFGWKREDVSFLTSYLGLDVNKDFKSAKGLMRLSESFAIVKRLGVPASDWVSWIRPDVTASGLPLEGQTLSADDARRLINAVKAKHDDEQWREIVKPLSDRLREKRRAALVAYLVANPPLFASQLWKDVNDLYGHLLIDPEMGDCMITSRIKQAISSVQLFVQRCLMNLEVGVKADASTDRMWLQWKWRKNYRVWEANRKVFLYPENWVEPELRDDKTPFFKELENELLQNDITTETAEAAFLHYLERFDEVARLEIVGMYHQDEFDEQGNTIVNTWHVFGRTNGTPQVYYYRRWVDSSYWTAWEKVEVEIEGNHLIPVVWNRRLYLLWPVFTKEVVQEPFRVPVPGGTIDRPPAFYKLQIAWSQLKNKKWSSKKLSKMSLMAPPAPLPEFFFRAPVPDPDLVIECYTTSLSILPDVGDGDSDRFDMLGTPVWRIGEFRFDECNSEPVPTNFDTVVLQKIPLATRNENMALVEHPFVRVPLQSQGLVVFVISGAPLESDELYIPDENGINHAVLVKTPGTFHLLLPHHFHPYGSQTPIFFYDAKRAYFIIPKESEVPIRDFNTGDQINPGTIDDIGQKYFAPFTRAVGPGPLVSAGALPNSTFVKEVALRSKVISRAPMAVANIDIGPGNGDFELGDEAVDIGIILNPPPFKPTQPGPVVKTKYLFKIFYHPYVCPFIKELKRNGIDGLMRREIQINPPSPIDFSKTYLTVGTGPERKEFIRDPLPQEDVDFLFDGAYAQYNWELFFHIPLMIADRLSKNQRFEDAQKWFHYIFNPTDGSSITGPERFWRTKPFFNASSEEYQRQKIENLLSLQPEGIANPELRAQVKQWQEKPFSPHAIARLRTVAYQKTVVMKYIDNLIAWGDQLFRRDTLESINEATQLYMLAAAILGERPQKVHRRIEPQIKTYSLLREQGLDDFSNAAENLVPAMANGAVASASGGEQVPTPTSQFCIQKNDKLLSYWDTVADRLFKIRHCMNIEGVVRQLALFEPPIDPALLVRAAAAGLDISAVLNDVNAPLPPYRFNVMMQKATELCSEVKGLGAALLSALEKRDTETLSLLRSNHEITLLNAVRQVKERQRDEAKENVESLKRSRDVIQIRQEYYANIQRISPLENQHLFLSDAAKSEQFDQLDATNLANSLQLLPNVKIGAPTSVGATFGGDNLGSAAQLFASNYGMLAAIFSATAAMTQTLASYERRFDDWKLQERLADAELLQIEKQITAAEIRLDIAERELSNHDLQIENAKEAHEFMRDKFTNRELYDWMVSQISAVYFKSYQLAYDVAKRAERTFRYELGLDDSDFVQFNNWDSLKKGLLAGERLYHDLKRMDVSYLDRNKREYELTKHLSLMLFDPIALVKLKQTGQCFIDIPESAFDKDYPGHYMRRIKSISLTIPCVTGPYMGINCTLTLLGNSVRKNAALVEGQYGRIAGSEDNRFRDSVGAIQSIATSTAQNDGGLFEINFRDERYLPFEGAGATSRWRIELPKENNAFDFRTISDVILHIRYTAREGGGALRQTAQAELDELAQTGVVFFSAKHDFPGEWHRFLHPQDLQPGGAWEQTLTLKLSDDRLPFRFKGKPLASATSELFLVLKDEADYDYFKPPVDSPLPQAPASLAFDLVIGGTSFLSRELNSAASPAGKLPYSGPLPSEEENLNEWSFRVREHALIEGEDKGIAALPEKLRRTVDRTDGQHFRLTPQAFDDLWIVCQLEAQSLPPGG